MSSAPPRWAAPLAAAVACSAFALWNPPLRDLAAHTFRAEYFEQHGFAIWNGTWYGGHYLLVLQRAVPAARRAAVAGVGRCAAPRSRAHGCSTASCASAGASRRRWAGLWFAALGAVALLANGWLAFALGVAFALGALRALQARPPRHRRRCWRVGCGAGEPGGGRCSSRWCCAVGASLGAARGPALDAWRAGAGAAGRAGLLFPGGRRSSRSGSRPTGRWRCSARGALLAIRGPAEERPRRARRDRRLPGARRRSRGWCPTRSAATSRGSGRCSAGRSCSRSCSRAGPRRAARAGRSRCWSLALALAGDHSAARHVPEPRRPLDRALLLRSRSTSWLDGARRASASASRSRTRSTTGRRRTCRRASALARGWLRQLDLERNHLFYEGEPDARALSPVAAREGHPLRRASDARLDYSAEDEDATGARRAAVPAAARAPRALARLRGGAPGSDAARSWGAAAPASRRSAPESFDARASTRPGRFVVRVRRTPYWRRRAERRLRGPRRRLDAGARRPARTARVRTSRFSRSGARWRAARGQSELLNVAIAAPFLR